MTIGDDSISRRDTGLDHGLRTHDPTGFNNWVNLLNTGQQTREQVVNGFLRSSEGLGRVVRVIPQATSETPAGMGVEFVNFDDESMELIGPGMNSGLYPSGNSSALRRQ